LDKRFLGLLKNEHVLELGFAKALDEGPGQPVLRIDGWLEYPYSQTCFAAWQAGLTYDPASLEVRGADGQWQMYLEKFGYPAGMPRTMSLPLDGLPKGITGLRLRTNQEIYWDRISVVYRQEVEVTTTRLPLGKAVLAEEGFAQRTTYAQALPHYDDQRRVPLWDTRHQAGFHTAFGEVTPLLSKQDDALAIYGPGEAVTLSFPAPHFQPKPGHTRIYVLESNGWCKDMDLYTKDGETIEPLPLQGEPSEERATLHRQFQTRYRSGY